MAVQNIRNMADGQEKIINKTEYTPDEIRSWEIKTFENIKLTRALNRQIKDLNSQKKQFLAENESLYDKLEAGFKEETVDAFYIDNFDTNMREYYNVDGEIIQQRALKHSEKNHQLKITKAM
jgi:cell division septum initiation protein DivIVA